MQRYGERWTDMTFSDNDACVMPSAADVPDDESLTRLFARATSIAVVGASPNPDRTSNQIAVWLMENTPYEIFLVNPRGGDEDILGHGFYDRLDSLPVIPDIVDVFRAPQHVPDVAVDAIKSGAGTLWLQLGIRHDPSALLARQAGMDVVQNHCIKVEYRRLAKRIEDARAIRA